MPTKVVPRRVMDKQTLLVKRISKVDMMLSVINVPIGIFFLYTCLNEPGDETNFEAEQEFMLHFSTIYYYTSSFFLCCFMILVSIYGYIYFDEERSSEVVKKFTRTSASCSILVVTLTTWMLSPCSLAKSGFDVPVKWALIVLVIMYRGIVSYYRIKEMEKTIRNKPAKTKIQKKS